MKIAHVDVVKTVNVMKHVHVDAKTINRLPKFYRRKIKEATLRVVASFNIYERK